MPKRRIFIAVDISDDARRSVAGYITELRSRFSDVRVGWERPEKLHFTLKFLGQVEDAIVSQVENAITGVIHRYRPFNVELWGTGIFPSAREPRILWLGLKAGREAMVALGTDIESAVEHLGFAPDPRTFSPHLTIGRIREPTKGGELAADHVGSGFGPVQFSVDHVTIYESILAAPGSTYAAISRVPLRHE